MNSTSSISHRRQWSGRDRTRKGRGRSEGCDRFSKIDLWSLTFSLYITLEICGMIAVPAGMKKLWMVVSLSRNISSSIHCFPCSDSAVQISILLRVSIEISSIFYDGCAQKRRLRCVKNIYFFVFVFKPENHSELSKDISWQLCRQHETHLLVTRWKLSGMRLARRCVS